MNKEKNKNIEINQLKENLPIKLLEVKHVINDQKGNKLIFSFENADYKKQITLMGTISLNQVDLLINALTELKNDYTV